MAATFTLVLAAHRPWLGLEPCAEEDWYFASLAGAYLPIIDILERLHQEGVRAPVAVAVSSTLVAMLDDPERRRRAIRTFAEREASCALPPRDPALKPALDFHRDRYLAARIALEGSGYDIPGRLRALEEDGCVELLACAATNAVLPLLPQDAAVSAQLRLAAAEHSRRFGRAAAGLWLPECGYDPRLGPIAASAGFEYVFADHHALERARPRPRCGAYAPIRARGGVFVLAADPETRRDTARLGPYAHPDYAEPSLELSADSAGGATAQAGMRPLGLPCRRVTGDVGLAQKEPYRPDAARRAAQGQADAFAGAVEQRAARLTTELKTRPVIVVPLEFELFGHEWLEGPAFLERLLRRLAQSAAAVPRTPAWVLSHAAEAEEAEPETSTWGPGGYFEAWLQESNAWLLPHAHGVTERMLELAARFGPRAEAYPSPLEERALNACARLCVLTQSSDWALLIASRSQAEWAGGRVADFVAAFLELRGQLEQRRVAEADVARAERLAAILPSADFRVFA